MFPQSEQYFPSLPRNLSYRNIKTMQTTIYLFDTQESHENLLPLSFTRPVAAFRLGLSTIREKWNAFLPGEYRYLPVEYLQEKYGNPPVPASATLYLFITGGLLPDAATAADIAALGNGEAITDGEEPVAFYGSYSDFCNKAWKPKPMPKYFRLIRYVFDVFLHNYQEIENDFCRLTAHRLSSPLDDTNTVIGNITDTDGMPRIFIETGAVVEGAILNVKNGPIYIGKNAEVMEGACLRGPIALCNNAKIKMGAKIYGGTSLGPFCKVGGEVDNTVFFGYSNKAHDGYLGNAVIGEWCNIGAGVNASNLKNDYSKIRVWNYRTHTFMRTDLQFCGLIMGDHSKIGVNCMLNTATVIGAGVNIHGAGFPRVFVPSFSEGSPVTGFTDVTMKKFLDIAERVMSRRGKALDDNDRRIYEKIYEIASQIKR